MLNITICLHKYVFIRRNKIQIQFVNQIYQLFLIKTNTFVLQLRTSKSVYRKQFMKLKNLLSGNLVQLLFLVMLHFYFFIMLDHKSTIEVKLPFLKNHTILCSNSPIIHILLGMYWIWLWSITKFSLRLFLYYYLPLFWR